MLRMIAFAVLVLLIAAGFWLYTPDLSRDEVTRRHPSSAGADIEAAGIHLNVRDEGPKDGEAILFLHGLGSSLATWDDVAAQLRAANPALRILRFDLPGFGLTGPDPTGDYSDTRTIAIIAALLDRLGIAKATLAGNSLGGRFAWRFAAAHPERTDRLILISPDGFASPGFQYGKAPDVPFLLRLLPYVLPKFLLRMQLAPAYGDPAVLTNALTDRYYDLMRAPGVRAALIVRTEQTVLIPPEPILAQIVAPTLLIWGEKDALIPFANSAEYLKLIPGSTLTPLPGIGHIPQEEAPTRTADLIGAFVRSGVSE